MRLVIIGVYKTTSLAIHKAIHYNYFMQCATHQNLGWKILVQDSHAPDSHAPDSHAPALHAISLLMVLIVSSLVGLLLL